MRDHEALAMDSDTLVTSEDINATTMGSIQKGLNIVDANKEISNKKEEEKEGVKEESQPEEQAVQSLFDIFGGKNKNEEEKEPEKEEIHQNK